LIVDPRPSKKYSMKTPRNTNLRSQAFEKHQHNFMNSRSTCTVVVDERPVTRISNKHSTYCE